MSGETEKDVSGWTTDTLRVYVENIFRLAQEQTDRRWDDERRAVDIALRAHDEALKVAAVTSKEAITAALAAQKEAVQVAQVAADQRAAAMNEWRQSLNDILTRSMTRAEAEAGLARLTESVHEVRLVQQGMVSRTEFEHLATRITQAESLARGAQASRAGIYAAIGAAVALITVVVLLANFLT